ncbi:ADA2, partial [Symbiodinium sp. KB8]
MSLAPAQAAAAALGFQVFTGCPGWSALDELHLLDAIEKYGDIGSHVGKPLLECKQHYEEVYLTSTEAPLPESARLAERAAAAEQTALAPDEVVKQVLQQEQQEQQEQRLLSAAAGASAPLPTDSVASEPAVAPGAAKHGPDEELLTRGGKSAPRSRSRGRSKSKSRGGAGAQGSGAAAAADDHAAQVVDPDISGFLPLRGDFEVEWDNDAELMLADMEFREGEHPTETELKLKVVEIYNAKLDERERRKRFVLERGLLDFKARLADERRRPREEREIRNMLRPFARFHSHADHETLVESLMEEHRIRRRIAQLQHWRRNGVRTLAEADEYEKAKQIRARERKQRRQREQASHLYGSAATLASSAGDPSQSRSRRRERYASRAAEPAPAADEAPALTAPAKRPRADVKPGAAPESSGADAGPAAATPM